MPKPAASDSERTLLLDVTRLISRSWTARHSTGIDRVCYAYLRHYRSKAFAVVQHRGLVRTLPSHLSEQLFDMLLAPAKGFRARFTAWATSAFLSPMPDADITGFPYINVSHTDFDLPQHFEWAARFKLRCFYFIHDLIPILHPEFSRPHAVRRHLGRVKGALRHADGIIVSSDAVAGDLLGFARAENVQIPTTLIAPIAGQPLTPAAHVSPAHHPSPNDQQNDPAHPSQRPFFLCVGTVEPRKNYRMLLDVWGKLAERMGEYTPRLVIVGQTGAMTGDILEPLRRLAPYAELRTDCSDQELASMMAGAEALLMPSLAEGYGLPVAETLRLGTRVIASDRAIFREIGQDLPQFVDPADPDAWAEAITNCAANPATPDEKTSRAARFSAHSWAEHFAAVDDWMASSGLKTGGTYGSSLAA